MGAGERAGPFTGDTGTVDGGTGHGAERMDSLWDLGSGWDIVGGDVVRSVVQRCDSATGAGAASTGLSGLAGDWRYASAWDLEDAADSEPVSEGEGECTGSTMGVGFGLILEGRSESSQPDERTTGVRGGGDEIVKRVENRVE